MPESMSLERRQLLEAYGAEIVLTPERQQMEGAIAQGRARLPQRRRGRSCPSSSRTRRTRACTRETTACELLQAMEGLRVDAFVAGRRHGRHDQRRRRVLRRERPPARASIAVEPDACATISRGERGPTKIQGSRPASCRRTTTPSVVDEVRDGDRRRRVADEGAPREARGAARRDQRGRRRARRARGGARARRSGEERRHGALRYGRAILQPRGVFFTGRAP